MPYLVKSGSLTVVAASASEALSTRDILDGETLICDMDGVLLDPEKLRDLVAQIRADLSNDMESTPRR